MDQNEIAEKYMESMSELAFMYRKYEELCLSYKKLADKMEISSKKTVNDMSHMSFVDENNTKEKH
jgi:hypothetical protein